MANDTGEIVLIEDDILNFKKFYPDKLDLILCMTDTLAHLDSLESINGLFKRVSESLAGDGKFLLSYRDQSVTLAGANRFIPFYSNEDLILTTFLEQSESDVTVNDIFYAKKDGRWEMNVSSYRKLRLTDEKIHSSLESNGLRITGEYKERGMSYLLCVL